MEICGGRETQPDSEEQEKEQIANSYLEGSALLSAALFLLIPEPSYGGSKKGQKDRGSAPNRDSGCGGGAG